MKKEIAILIIAIVIVAVLVVFAFGMTGRLTGGEPTGCSDSDADAVYTDGKNYFVQGETTYENRNVAYKDYCVKGEYINEYYCLSTNTVKSERQFCENGCLQGACVR